MSFLDKCRQKIKYDYNIYSIKQEVSLKTETHLTKAANRYWIKPFRVRTSDWFSLYIRKSKLWNLKEVHGCKKQIREPNQTLNLH